MKFEERFEKITTDLTSQVQFLRDCSIMAEPWPQNRHLEHRTRALSATNVSAEFILNSVALAGDSQYVAELDRFVPLPEAKHHEDAM